MNAKACQNIPPAWHNHCSEHDLDVVEVTFGSPGYRDVLSLRSDAYGIKSAPEPIDEYSTLWLAYKAGVPLATLRVTYARIGWLECQERFPVVLFENFRDQVGSASRFCAPRAPSESRIARLMVEVAWRRALADGIRIDVIDVNVRAVRYYQKLGYVLVPGSEFVHPVLHTPSVVMYLALQPDSKGTLADALCDIPKPYCMVLPRELSPS